MPVTRCAKLDGQYSKCFQILQQLSKTPASFRKDAKKGHLPDYKHFKLIDVCRTRWVLQIDGLERFLAMCVATAEALPFVIMLIDYGTLQQVMYMHFPY